jgi:hypothetical protein
MIRFAAAVSTAHDSVEAAREAAGRARASMGSAMPRLAVVFASPAYDGLDGLPRVLEAELGSVPLVGGTSGGAVFDVHGVAPRGVLVALLGGDGVRAATFSAPSGSPELIDVVPAGASLLAEADRAAHEGLSEALCLAFAPAQCVDGEALVAAVRKGAGPRMQLAGALVGDDFTFDRACVFTDGGARPDRVVLAGVFTKTRAGVAAQHGWRAVGPSHVVTRSDGAWLYEVDGRRALDVWLEEVRAADGNPPADHRERLVYLANHYSLGIETPTLVEPIVRSPLAERDDGAVRLAAGIAEGTRVRVMRGSTRDMLDASRRAAEVARERAGGTTSGALVFSCSGRLSALSDRFAEEPAGIARSLDAPVAGACVFGEIARAHREIDAFHNTTAVVVACPR